MTPNNSKPTSYPNVAFQVLGCIGGGATAIGYVLRQGPISMDNAQLYSFLFFGGITALVVAVIGLIATHSTK